MLYTDKNLVICGFPGVGKSIAEEKRKDTMDLESSRFKWTIVQDGEDCRYVVNPGWPLNYVNEIVAQYKNAYRIIILVSTHKEVIRHLQARKIPFLIVAPSEDVKMKNEYLIRFLQRGSTVDFIKDMDANWFRYLREITEHGETVIRLGSGQYLTDILPL